MDASNPARALQKRLPHGQRGAVLIVSLLILIVMTLIGITAMGTSGLEEKMAGNSRDLNLAFQAAEAALKDAEDYLVNDITSTTAFDGSYPGLYPPVTDTNPPPDFYTDSTWSTAISYSGTIDKVATPPKYIIELVGSIGSDDINISGYGESSGSGEITTFRITARGTGGTDNAAVLLQSYYGRRF